MFNGMMQIESPSTVSWTTIPVIVSLVLLLTAVLTAGKRGGQEPPSDVAKRRVRRFFALSQSERFESIEAAIGLILYLVSGIRRDRSWIHKATAFRADSMGSMWHGL